jgi:hypothetical protein
MGATAPTGQTPGNHATGQRGASTLAGERAARRDLREQIGRLERELADAFVTAYPFGGLTPDQGAAAPDPGRGPARLLTLAELELIRDRLAGRLAAARAQIAAYADRQEQAVLAREQAYLEPAAHRFMRISCRALGEPGCAYEVRPRLGLIGMLMDWWQVKLSSGCPLPGLIGAASCARC